MTKATKFVEGQKVTFTGYTQLDAGQDEILTVGAEYTVAKDNGDNSYQVVGNDGKGDTVFNDEIAAVEKKTAKKATTPKKATTAKAKSTKSTTAKKTTTKKPAKATEPKADKIVPIAPVPVTVTDSQSVMAILESKDMLTAAKELAVAAEETFISLGGVLSHIYKIGAHKQLGYDGKRGFADYMLKELNINYRKGMYLIEIYDVARQFNLDERLLAEIGWSKMKEIANRIDAENAKDLLEYARDHNREELVAHVRKTYVKAGQTADDPGRVQKTRLTFNLFGDQADVVERALAAAEKQIDNATPEMALMLVCSEWSQFTENVTLSAEEAAKALVARFGVDAIQAVVQAQLADIEEKTSAPKELVEA